MSHLPAGRRKQRKFLRIVGCICGFILAILPAAVGAAGFVLIGFLLYSRIYKGGGISDPWVDAGILATIGLLSLFFLLLGVAIFRKTVRFQCDGPLDDIDLDKQPWMANEEWRRRRILHSNWIRPVALFAFLLGIPLLFLIIAVTVKNAAADILAISIMMTGGIIITLGFLLRYLEKKKIAITLQNFWMFLFLPLIIVMPGTWGLFSPVINKLLETTAMFLLVFLLASAAIYLYRKKRKFGISTCHLKTLPAFIGGFLDAEIEITFPKMKTGMPELPEGPVELELVNITAVGRSQRINWSSQSTVQPHALIRSGDGTLRIPIEISIPDEAGEKIPKNTFWTGSVWNLKIRAPFPGVDYSSWFSVPVYFRESAEKP